MKIISIDVGIKNLAFCILERDDYNTTTNTTITATNTTTPSTTKGYRIMKWDVIDLSQKVNISCCEPDLKKHAPCQNDVKYTKYGKHYCLKHAKKMMTFSIPGVHLKLTNINKQKIQGLKSVADKYQISYPPSAKKKELMALLVEYTQTKCFESIENVNASKMDLVTIGKNIHYKFDEQLMFGSCDDGCSEEEVGGEIDTVIIENQISPIANRMKTIQGMIAQYFIMKYGTINIEFVNASNKLKTGGCFESHDADADADAKADAKVDADADAKAEADADAKVEAEAEAYNEKIGIGIGIGHTELSGKSTYSDRKKEGIRRTTELLELYRQKSNANALLKNDYWLTFFKNHKKRDDLADSFLQGIWYLFHKK